MAGALAAERSRAERGASFYSSRRWRGPQRMLPSGAAFLLLLLLGFLSGVDAQCLGGWESVSTTGPDLDGVARSGGVLYQPEDVTICTAEYTPFVFLRQSTALERYYNRQTVKQVLAIANLPDGLEAAVVGEQIPVNMTIREFITEHPEFERSLARAVQQPAEALERERFYDTKHPLSSFAASFQGMDVELMRAISVFGNADFSLYHTRFRVILKRTYPDALWGAKTGECDMAVGGFVRTAARSQCPAMFGAHKCNATSGVPGNITSQDVCCLAWSQPYQKTGISFLTQQTRETGWEIARRNIMTPLNLSIVSILAISLIISGHLIWLIERHENPHMFPPAYLDGVDDGIWWSLVTMTTVGYGDKVPITMSGRFLAFLWMMVGLINFAFFTSSISGIIHEIQDVNIWEPVPIIKSRISNREVKLCTVGGVYEEVLNLEVGSTKLAKNINECYEYLKDGHEVAIAFDRPALVYDVQRSLGGLQGARGIEGFDDFSSGMQGLTESIKRQGVVISEPLRSTYAAIAFRMQTLDLMLVDRLKREAEGWMSIQEMVNQAMNFILHYQGGIYIDATMDNPGDEGSGMENVPPLDSGWSIDDSRSRWLPKELNALEAMPYGDNEVGKSSYWGDASSTLAIIAAAMLAVYLVVQFGGLFLRRQRKIRRIRNGVSRMPSGFDKPSDLPFYYNEKSQAERANDELREEMLRVRGEIDSLKSMLSTRLQDTGSRSTGGSDQGPSRTQTLRGRLFGRRRKTTENKSKLDPSTPLQSSNLLGSAVHFALADMQTSGNQLGNAANFAPEIGRDRSVDAARIMPVGSNWGNQFGPLTARQLLYRRLRLVTCDGRVLVGELHCMDAAQNLILRGAVEEGTNPSSGEREERVLGQVMVPLAQRASCEVEVSWAEEARMRAVVAGEEWPALSPTPAP
eukprot:jgi/Tetstr1/424542/TSEL_015069.t1